MKALLLAMFLVMTAGKLVADEPVFILITVTTNWKDGMTSDAGEVERVVASDSHGYAIICEGKQYVVPTQNAVRVTAEQAALALLDQREKLYQQLTVLDGQLAQAQAAPKRPTQYNGRPLPPNWIDPKQADANFFAQQQAQQQAAQTAELMRLQQQIQLLQQQQLPQRRR